MELKVKLCFLFLLCSLFAYSGDIERVEPPFWWTGLNNSELQIMVYGNAIGKFKPQIHFPGIELKRAVSVENTNYIFLYLEIYPDAHPGKFTIDFINEKNDVECSVEYELLEREENAAQRKGFDNSDVMYLITPDRFANSNTNNDSVEGMLEKPDRDNKGGRHGGDIQGIQNQLGYLSNMGFTAIWLNPVLENNQSEYSYHGYSTTNFYKVDPRFGTNEEYKTLSVKAKENEIKLVMDMILNHCGSGHWWMDDLPSSDWVNNPSNYFMTNHRRTTHRDPYASEYDSKHFTDGWFVPTMPDINQKNPLLADYLIQNTIWWIEYAKLSGIRMDTYSYSDKKFMRDWTCAVMNEYPGFNICGEEWSINPAVLAYWQSGKVNNDGYTSCLPGLLDFPLQHALIKALNAKDNWDSGMIELYEMLSNDFLYADPSKHVIFPDNHDMSRIFTQLNDDYGLFKLAITYFATMRGTPQFYYGTEILMSNTGDNSHGNIRSDFPGGWPEDTINAFNGTGLSPQQIEALDYVKIILNWRKKATVVHNGLLMHFAPVNGVYVFFRYDDLNKVMVVLNKTSEQQNLDLAPFKELLKDKVFGRDIISGERIELDNYITVDSKRPLIIEID